MAMHPEGMARLIAVMLVTGDVEQHPKAAGYEDQIIDMRRSQVLSLAREHYKVYPCDFDTSNDHDIEEGARNGRNNLAKLNRKNLR